MNNKGKLTLIITAASMLVACGGATVDPAALAKYQKVSKAFNGVERALSNTSTSKSLAKLPNYQVDIRGDMDSLEQYFENAQSDETLEEQVNLYTPPFIQFLYLKTIYERIGATYEFGTKYAHNITGEMYIDIETGYQDEERNEANKYAYNLNFSVSVNIDDNDLISADVTLDSTLTQGEKTYKGYRFAKMILDYDFSTDNNDFEMALYDATDEADLAYLSATYGYEYDYCLVNNGEIDEWRKLRYESSVPLIKDSNHPTLDSYIDDGATITTSNNRWYKNGVMKRVDQDTTDSLAIARVLYSKFGINDTDLGIREYRNKEAKDSNVIQTIYQEASRQTGNELIYSLVCNNHKDDEEIPNPWPNDQIIHVINRSFIVFPVHDNITFSYEFTTIEGAEGIIITVNNASDEDYSNFYGTLEFYGMRPNDEGMVRYYTLEEQDGSLIIVVINRSENKILIYRAASSGPQYHVDLGRLLTFGYPYSGYSLDQYSNNKDIYNFFNDYLSRDDSSRALENKINLNESFKAEFTFNEDVFKEIGVNNAHDAAKNVLENYESEYRSKWTSIDNYPHIFTNVINDGLEIAAVFDTSTLQDGKLTVHCFVFNKRGTTEELLSGQSSSNLVKVPIYVHHEDGSYELDRYIECDDGFSVYFYIDIDHDYYLDGAMTTKLEESIARVYDGMQLHYRDYIPSVNIEGGERYTQAFSYYYENVFTSENEVMDYLANQVQELMPLYDYVKVIKLSNTKRYTITLNDEYNLPVGMTIAQYARTQLDEYLRQYSSWNVGKEGTIYYKQNEKMEDAIIILDQRLKDEIPEFEICHVAFTRSVMDAIFNPVYETVAIYVNSVSANGSTRTDTLYVDERSDVRNALGSYSGDKYLDSSYQTPLNDSNCSAYDGMNIYIKPVLQTVTIPIFYYQDKVLISGGALYVTEGTDVRTLLTEQLKDGAKLYLDSTFFTEVTDSNCYARKGMELYLNKTSVVETYVDVTIYFSQDGSYVNSMKVSVLEGSDIRERISVYTGDKYLDSNFTTPLDDFNSNAYDGMQVYINKTSEPQIEMVDVLVMYHKDGVYDSFFSVKCEKGKSVLEALKNISGDKYLDSNFATPLDESNSSARSGMIVYINEVTEVPQIEYVKVSVILYENGNKTGTAEINAQKGDDIRNYLQEYSGSFYLNSSFSAELNDSNCSVKEGMTIHINKVTQGGEEPEQKEGYIHVFRLENGSFKFVETIQATNGDDARNYLNAYVSDYTLYVNEAMTETLGDSNNTVTKDKYIYIVQNAPVVNNTNVNVLMYKNGSMVGSKVVEAQIGKDVRQYLTQYEAYKKYVDKNLSVALDGTNCTVYEGMTIYIDIGGGSTSQNTTLTIVTYQNGEQTGSSNVTAKIGQDVRNYLASYTGTFYLDESFSNEVNDSNCAVTSNMTVYVVLPNQEAPSKVNVTIYLYKGGSLADTTNQEFDVGEDVRTFLRQYRGDMFVDEELSTPLTYENAKAFEGMTIYIVMR